jgi:nitrite reductase/ring-hydroxylating ferredoxin subunit
MSSKRSFFDPRLLEFDDAVFLDPGKIDEALRRLMPSAFLSKGSFSYPSRAPLCDLVWNHMDQNHRPLIHSTYEQAARVFIDRRASFSLTRFGKWPIAIPVFDGYVRENCFYQVMVLFGLVIVVCLVECKESESGTSMEISWTTASHWLLRFIHPYLNRRIRELNDVQNRDDDPIRDQRVALREAQYRFATDDPDFINSNVMANNVKFPPVAGTHTIAMETLPEGQPHKVVVADRTLIVRRTGKALEVWPGICPHEGAPIETRDLKGTSVVCAWHGLEFGPRRLGPASGRVVVCGAALELAGDELKVGPAPALAPALGATL